MRTGATGVYSYMYQFMSEVRDNEPFGTAHSTARSSMLYLYGDQEPKLSVDGDSSLEETDDYWDASNLYLEHSVAANNEPTLSSSKGNDAYTTSSGNFEFWASASDVDGDSFNVFAQVIPPSSSPLKATTIALNTYDAVLTVILPQPIFSLSVVFMSCLITLWIQREGISPTKSAYVTVTDDSAPGDVSDLGVYSESVGGLTLELVAECFV